jgi:multiple sugar transport system ATP-binding protein
LFPVAGLCAASLLARLKGNQSMSNVSIKDLNISFGKTSVIENLHLDIKVGEFVVLLGPSGCGKSTLLHSIAGLIDVTDGQVEIAGKDVTWADPKDRGIGMVFQSYALYPTMTVERNLSFGLRISGMPKAEISKRVDNAARMLQLTELLQRKPAQLSGGQRQRVAIGRALVREAKVFLLDEPLSNLDAKLRAELRRELKQLHHDLGATMIYVTHDQIEAMTLATRLAVMRAGKIQQLDAPDVVYARPANMFVAGFLGSPSMNFIKGHLRNSGGRVQFESAVLQADVSDYGFAQMPADNQPTVLGIRPEHLHMVAADAPRNAQATLGLIEPMGAYKIVWLDAQGSSLALQVEPTTALTSGTLAHLAMDPGHVSLFDATTENRL